MGYTLDTKVWFIRTPKPTTSANSCGLFLRSMKINGYIWADDAYFFYTKKDGGFRKKHRFFVSFGVVTEDNQRLF